MNNLLYELGLAGVHYIEFKLIKRVLRIEYNERGSKMRILKQMPSKEFLFMELINQPKQTTRWK